MDAITKLETYYGLDSYIRDTMDGYPQEIIDALLKYTELAHVEGEFRCVADREAIDTPLASPEATALAQALYLSGTEFYVGPGDYIVGSYGKGWIAWGLGCPLASAPMATFVDASFHD